MQSFNRHKVLQIPSSAESIERLIKKKEEPLKIRTWNKRTLYQTGKINNVIKEMKRLNINILGMLGNGEMVLEDDKFYYLENTKSSHHNGVGKSLIVDMRN